MNEIGIRAISLWETAKPVECGRLELPYSIDEWIDQAIHYPDIRIFNLTPDMAIESTRLPGEFNRDPADQMIVATARVNDCLRITPDDKIPDYVHVETIGQTAVRASASENN